MTIQPVALPIPPPIVLGQPAFAGPSFEELDRQARGAHIRRPVEESDQGNRARRHSARAGRSFDGARPIKLAPAANDRVPRTRRRAGPEGEVGLHLAIDGTPERVLQSTPFLAQRLGQESESEDAPDLRALGTAALAYENALAHTAAFFGLLIPIEIIA